MTSIPGCQSPALPTVDTHLHVFERPVRAAPGARYRPDYAAPLRTWREIAAACGVRRGVLVQPSFLGTDNRELLAALAQAPDRLRGVVVLDPATTPDRLAELDAAGVRGLRWNTVGDASLDSIGDPRWPSVLAAAHAHGWHLELHTDPGRLPEVLDRLPAVPIALVIDHFGRPASDRGDEPDATLRAAERTARSREVWVKLSAPYRLPGAAHGALAAGWCDTLGADRLLWGSDWPWTNHERENAYAGLHALPARWLASRCDGARLDRNAEQLFRWQHQAPAP